MAIEGYYSPELIDRSVNKISKLPHEARVELASGHYYSEMEKSRERWGLTREEHEVYRNSPTSGLFERNLAAGQLSIDPALVPQWQQRLFWYYWHTCFECLRREDRKGYEEYRSRALSFDFVNKLPAYDEYRAWSDAKNHSSYDEEANGYFGDSNIFRAGLYPPKGSREWGGGHNRLAEVY